MEKSYVINRIKELCNKKNDREIALDFFYNNTDADFENAFLKTEYYRRFYRHITRISLVRSKNKRINDKLIFSEDG